MITKVQVGMELSRDELLNKLVEVQYSRSRTELDRGKFRAIGNYVDIMPSNVDDKAMKIKFDGDYVSKIYEIDSYTSEIIRDVESVFVFPGSHYVVEKLTTKRAIESIKKELKEQKSFFKKKGKLEEMKRIEERTIKDLELMEIMGFCPGIENYSRHLDQRRKGEPPFTLINYFPNDFLLIIDESHQTIPQIRGMYEGDRSRKQTLVDHGFRLPSALDNRPLNIKEFEKKINQIVYVSATPAKYEIEKSSNNIIEQIIRPTGLVDPQIEVRPAKKQIDNVLIEINKTIQKKEKVLITTLTKRMSEELTAYFKDLGLRIEYMHSDIHTLERIEIIKKLRSDKIDVLVGINLLREGLDIPEVSLVIILDADKEGFLRSATSLIQMFGRASRNLNGRVIMYAEEITESMKVAIQESSRRREKQLEFNKKNKITPRSIKKKVDSDISSIYNIDYHEPDLDKYLTISPHEISSEITRLKKQMDQLSKKLQFEEAARVRDQIKKLRKLELTFAGEIA
jgi:excinuclease ABC subunit B